MSIYAKLKKAYKNYTLTRRVRKQLTHHDGIIFLHDTHFARAVPRNPKYLIYDCVDLPLMHQRTSKTRRNKHKYFRMFVDCMARKAVAKANLILFTSPFYQSFVSNWIDKDFTSVLLRNYTSRDTHDLEPNKVIKKYLRSEETVSHWLVIHNRIGEFLDIDNVLSALSKLNSNWGLCLLGVFDGKHSISSIQKRAKELCPSHVVICHEAIYGNEKLAALKCFDLGLVPLIAQSQNLKRCIPNRTLEFLGVGLPQIAFRTKAHINLSNEFPNSIFVPQSAGQESFESLLMETCQKIEKNKFSQSSETTPDWSEDFQKFFDILNDQIEQKSIKKEVIILSENNPLRNNRLANIQIGLKENGYDCAVLEIDTNQHKVINHAM